MAPMDRPKRMLVRTSIVAGSTVATLIGAQTLITVDKQNPNLNGSASTVEIQVQNTAIPQQPLPTATQVIRALPTINIIHAAPSITIVRQAGRASNQPAETVAAQPTAVIAQAVIKPPAPVEIAPPAPIIVQQPSSSQASGSSSGGGQSAPAPAPAPRTSSSR